MSPNYHMFKPSFFLRNRFAQTIIGSKFSGKTRLPKRRIHKIKASKQSELILFELLSKKFDSSMVLLAHGMGGCSESQYIRRTAWKLWLRGFSVFMMKNVVGDCNS